MLYRYEEIVQHFHMIFYCLTSVFIFFSYEDKSTYDETSMRQQDWREISKYEHSIVTKDLRGINVIITVSFY